MMPPRGYKRRHTPPRLIGAFVAVSAGVLALSWSNATGRPLARAAHVLAGTDTAHLSLVHSGETLLEEGPASGVLNGRMRAELHLGPVYTGSFTIDSSKGRISGVGRATPQGSGRYQSFTGTWTVLSGSGTYAHVHGHDSLHGVFDRRTYTVVMTTTGSLYY
jgi:hypothetical protein